MPRASTIACCGVLDSEPPTKVEAFKFWTQDLRKRFTVRRTINESVHSSGICIGTHQVKTISAWHLVGSHFQIRGAARTRLRLTLGLFRKLGLMHHSAEFVDVPTSKALINSHACDPKKSKLG